MERFFETCHRAKNERVPLMDCDRKLTVCGTKVLLAERIIPTGIMACSQVTLPINTPHGAGFTIAFAIHSVDRSIFSRLILQKPYRNHQKRID